MDNKILYIAKFTHHDLKFHKVWWKSDKRFGSWSRQTDKMDRQMDRRTDRQKERFLYTPQTMFAGGIIMLSFKGFDKLYHSLSYWTHCDTSDNVCLDLHNC